MIHHLGSNGIVVKAGTQKCNGGKVRILMNECTRKDGLVGVVTRVCQFGQNLEGEVCGYTLNDTYEKYTQKRGLVVLFVGRAERNGYTKYHTLCTVTTDAHVPVNPIKCDR